MRFGQGEKKRRASIGFAFGPDAPAVTVDDALHVGQADAGTGKFTDRMQALKGPEKSARKRHVETGTIVAYIECRFSAGDCAADLDARSGQPAREFPCVGKQVLKHLVQQRRIRVRNQAGSNDPFDVAIWFGVCEIRGELPGERGQVQWTPVQFRPGRARKGEQIVDQKPHALARRSHPLEAVLTVFVKPRGVLLEQYPAEPVDAAQRRSQIVRYGVTKRFQLLVGRLKLERPILDTLLKFRIEFANRLEAVGLISQIDLGTLQF